MINVPVYGQRDRRWADTMLGFAPKWSRITIGSDGCALCSAAMVGNYLSGKNLNPLQLNEELKKRNGYAANRQGIKCLIIWAVVAAIYGIRYVGTKNYSNAYASWLVYVKRTPLIIEGSAPELGAVQHFRVLVGDRKQADPWRGTYIPTTVYGFRSVREFSK